MTHPDCTPARIRRAHRIAAAVVAEFGEQYLPWFERMEREIARLDRLEKATAIAREHTTPCTAHHNAV